MFKSSVVVLSLLTAGSVRAQLTILSDTRSIGVAGWVQDAGGNVTQSFSQTQTQSSSFAGFNGSVGGNANGVLGNNSLFSASTASQNSSATSAQLSFSGLVTASQAYPAPPGLQFSDAYSLFAVSFRVSSPVEFTLTDNQHNWNFIDANETVTLSSTSGGTIVSGPQLNPYGPGMDEYEGLLEPGQIYTLQVSLRTQDYSEPNLAQSFDVAFNTPELSPVPEPSSSLLLGLGVMGSMVLIWRKHRAAVRPAGN